MISVKSTGLRISEDIKDLKDRFENLDGYIQKILFQSFAHFANRRKEFNLVDQTKSFLDTLFMLFIRFRYVFTSSDTGTNIVRTFTESTGIIPGIVKSSKSIELHRVMRMRIMVF